MTELPEHSDVTETLRLLQAAHSQLRDEMASKWNRDLPWNELLNDRWERAERLKFKHGASIYDSACVFGDVEVGENTWVGPFTILDGSGGLSIGSWCSISAGVQIYTHESVQWALSGGRSQYQKAAVHIGDNCYIGSQTVVRMGVSIGQRCVVGACAYVNRDIPPNSVAVGVPARVVGKVEVDEAGEVRLVSNESQSGCTNGANPA